MQNIQTCVICRMSSSGRSCLLLFCLVDACDHQSQQEVKKVDKSTKIMCAHKKTVRFSIFQHVNFIPWIQFFGPFSAHRGACYECVVVDLWYASQTAEQRNCPQGQRLDPFRCSETKPKMTPTQYFAVEMLNVNFQGLAQGAKPAPLQLSSVSRSTGTPECQTASAWSHDMTIKIEVQIKLKETWKDCSTTCG